MKISREAKRNFDMTGGRMTKLAVVTGAGSGIGFQIARLLQKKGFRIVLAGRDKEKLQTAAERLAADSAQERQPGKKSLLFPCDLSSPAECLRLCEAFQNRPVRVLINCAGSGVYGDFDVTNLQEELEMAAVNSQAVHILMKAFLRDMQRRGGGSILNVASSAGLMPGGPYMAAYYASKSYVVSLTRSVAEELRAKNSPVYVGALCPGPVDTPFFERAGIGAAVRGAKPEAVACAALRGMRRRQTIIVPDAGGRLACAAARLLPGAVILPLNRRIQAGKRRAADVR